MKTTARPKCDSESGRHRWSLEGGTYKGGATVVWYSCKHCEVVKIESTKFRDGPKGWRRYTTVSYEEPDATFGPSDEEVESIAESLAEADFKREQEINQLRKENNA